MLWGDRREGESLFCGFLVYYLVEEEGGDSCEKAGFLEKIWRYYKMPAIKQFLRRDPLKKGGLTGNACLFAGITSNQGVKVENSCLFAGLIRLDAPSEGFLGSSFPCAVPEISSWRILVQPAMIFAENNRQ
ncbi:hypothetical protein ABE504_22595 [Paenibacillus oryzisoli]|uniref:hypothetical protein n=1 Tax=Paenibacillus oryzisoli TaxID=1850517 RepID=UPI003D2ABA8E